MPTEVERLAELSPVLLLSTDASGRLAFVKGAWERLLGWEPDDLSGLLAADLVHPSDRAELRRALQHARGAREGLSGVELRTATRDGRWRSISWQMRFDQGRWYGAGQDMGEKGRAARALAASQSRFRALVEQVPAIVYTAGIGADARWEYVSPQIETVLGYPADEWMDSHSLWYDTIHPDDRDRVLAEETAVAEPGGQLRSEYRMRRRDGEWIWVRDDATTFVGPDGTLQFQGVLLDITEAKGAEQAARDKHEQIQAIIDNSPVVIFAKDLDHRYILMNREAEELVEVEPGGALGKTDHDLMPAEFAQRSSRATDASSRAGRRSRRSCPRSSTAARARSSCTSSRCARAARSTGCARSRPTSPSARSARTRCRRRSSGRFASATRSTATGLCCTPSRSSTSTRRRRSRRSCWCGCCPSRARTG